MKKKKIKKVRKAIKSFKKIIYLIRQFYRIQEHRIAFGAQIRALKEGKLPTDPLEDYFLRLSEMEKEIGKLLQDSVKDEEVWLYFLKKIRGIGPIISAGLINLIDIKKARHISSLWKFAGLDVVNGKAPRFQKGQKATWNPLMRNLCWKIGKSFLMSNSPYRKFYDERKRFENRKHSELKKFHIEARARRFMVKRFLSDLWLFWRDLKGLPISLPYACDKLGHKYQKGITKGKK